MLEELYEEYVKRLLGHEDDDTHMTCSRDEFFRKAKAKDRRQAWKKQYYYRCLTVQLAQKFIDVMERQQRNYVETADIYDAFPHFNFHLVFRMICTALGGSYSRGKCYTQLTVDDFKHFIQLRNATRTAEELLVKWKQYINKQLKQKAEGAEKAAGQAG